MGFEILAITGEVPGKVSAFLEKEKLGLTVLADTKQVAALAFGIAFRLGDDTYEKYKGYGVDLEETSGEKHHILPVPAVFLVDAGGVIRFSYVNPDFKVRLDPRILKAAAQSMVEEKPAEE